VPHALAIDLGGTKCSAAIVDKNGHILSRRTVPVDVSSRLGPVRQILQLAKDLSAGKKPKQVFAAAAVAVPGLVRPNGTVWAPNLPGWNALPLASRLRQSLELPWSLKAIATLPSSENTGVAPDAASPTSSF